VFEWLPNNSGMPIANGFSLKGIPAIAGISNFHGKSFTTRAQNVKKS
jgi:hypothetical protein